MKHEEDWYEPSVADGFQVTVIFDEGPGNLQKPHRYLVEIWYWYGFEEYRTYVDKDEAIQKAKKLLRKGRGRVRVLEASEGRSFEPVE